MIPKWYTKHGNENIAQIKLSDFIYINGYNCTYIIIACRNFSSNITTNGIFKARTLSGR